MDKNVKSLCLGVLFFLFIFSSSNVYPTISTWNVDGNGNWNANGNWNPATFPNAIGDTANFLNVITNNSTITLGQTITIGSINFDNDNNYTLSGNTLVFSNAGPSTINVTNTNGNGLHSISSTVNLNNQLVITQTSSSNFTFSGTIGGTGNLTKEGGGTGAVVLGGTTANTYPGLTTINNGTLLLNKTAGVNAIAGSTVINAGGTLLLGANEQIINTGPITLSGGTFNLGGNTETIGRLIFNSGTLIQGGATLNLSNAAANALTMDSNTTIGGNIAFTSTGGITYTGASTRATIIGNINHGPSSNAHTYAINKGSDTIDMDISGSISGTGGITKTGTGVLQLSGVNANTYSGLTTINGGELWLNKTPGTNAIGENITINSGTLSLKSGNQISNTSTVTLETGGTFDMGGFNETIGSFLFNGGIFNQTGGLLTLTSNGSALRLSDSTVILGDISLTGTGNVTSIGTTAIATMSGNLDLGSATHTFSATDSTASTDLLFSGVISGSGGILILSPLSSSTIEFGGNAPNTYTGLTTVTRGNLLLSKSSGNAVSGDVSINNAQGTLTLANANQLSNISNLTLTNGTFNLGGFNQTINSYTYNSGTFNQGGGTLSLASPIAALTMRNTTISGNVAILNGGAVTFNPASGGTATLSGNIDLGTLSPNFNIPDGVAANDMLISGIISSSGAGLTKTGTGLLAFTGGASNTYSGLTTISSGTLLLNKTPGFNAISGDVLINGGLLSLGASDQIANTSTVTIESGTFNMGGFNETMGTLIFNGGTLTQGGGTLNLASPLNALTMRDTTLTEPIHLTGGGSIAFDNTNNGTATISGNIDQGGFTTTYDIANGTASTDMLISGIISNGGLTKTGAGTLVLTGASTYTGATTVSAGTLTVDGSLNGGGILTVDAGATLSGSGTITKNATIAGTLAPGNGIGTLQMVGNQVLAAGSTLDIEFNASSNDLLDITGGLTIQPNATLNLLPQVDAYPEFLSYTIARTTGGVNGTFSTVNSTLPMFIGSVTYTPFDILLLNVEVIPFSTLFFTGNAGAVACCLDKATNPSQDLSLVIDQLRMLPTQQDIECALLQMQPSAFTSLAIVQENNTLNFKNGIYNHFKLYPNKATLQRTSRPTLWISPFITHTSLHKCNKEPGMAARSPGLMGGIDFSLKENVCLGIGIGYNKSKLHWTNKRGNACIQGLNASLYGLWKTPHAYLEGALMCQYDSYSTARFINFGSLIDRKARGNHYGNGTSFHLQTGFNSNGATFSISPFAALDYLSVREKGFKEQGAQSLNLKVKNKKSDLLFTQIGIDISSYFKPGKIAYAPFVQVSAIRENRFKGKHEKASFNTSCLLDVVGLYPSRTLGAVAAGVQASFTPDTTLTFIYQGKYAPGYKNDGFQLQYQHSF